MNNRAENINANVYTHIYKMHAKYRLADVKVCNQPQYYVYGLCFLCVYALFMFLVVGFRPVFSRIERWREGVPADKR